MEEIKDKLDYIFNKLIDGIIQKTTSSLYIEYDSSIFMYLEMYYRTISYKGRFTSDRYNVECRRIQYPGYYGINGVKIDDAFIVYKNIVGTSVLDGYSVVVTKNCMYYSSAYEFGKDKQVYNINRQESSLKVVDKPKNVLNDLMNDLLSIPTYYTASGVVDKLNDYFDNLIRFTKDVYSRINNVPVVKSDSKLFDSLTYFTRMIYETHTINQYTMERKKILYCGAEDINAVIVHSKHSGKYSLVVTKDFIYFSDKYKQTTKKEQPRLKPGGIDMLSAPSNYILDTLFKSIDYEVIGSSKRLVFSNVDFDIGHSKNVLFSDLINLSNQEGNSEVISIPGYHIVINDVLKASCINEGDKSSTIKCKLISEKTFSIFKLKKYNVPKPEHCIILDSKSIRISDEYTHYSKIKFSKQGARDIISELLTVMKHHIDALPNAVYDLNSNGARTRNGFNLPIGSTSLDYVINFYNDFIKIVSIDEDYVYEQFKSLFIESLYHNWDEYDWIKISELGHKTAFDMILNKEYVIKEDK